MKKIITAVFILLLTTNFSYSQQVDIERLKIDHGPYLQNLSDTGVTIFWTTNRTAIPSVIITDPTGNARVIRNSQHGLFDGGGTRHKVEIDGLIPGSKYKYNLKSMQILKFLHNRVYYGDTLVQQELSFTTTDSLSDRIKFTVINDIHENSNKLALFLKNVSGDQDFYVFNGDMINFLQKEEQLYQGFLDTSVVYFASEKPFVFVRGNHETRGYLARDIPNYFASPNGKFYYSFKRGRTHFTVLDCGEDKPDGSLAYSGLANFDNYRLEQLEWLKKEVETKSFKNADYRIVLIHMPVVKEENQGHGMKFLQNNFGPILDNANIDLILSGHTHRNSFYDTNSSGFNYPVLVNSPNSFVEVEVEPNGIKATVKDVTGKIIYSYSVK